MCVSAVILRSGKDPIKARSLGELGEACRLQLEDIPLCQGLDVAHEPNFCLCILDAERLGPLLNYVVEAPRWDVEDSLLTASNFTLQNPKHSKH